MANCLVEVETCVRLGGMQPAGGLIAIGKRYPYGLDGNVGRDADDYLGV
jgi:hypothetical protein